MLYVNSSSANIINCNEIMLSRRINNVCLQVKGAVEDHAKKSYTVFEPHSYKTQVVAGTNYFVKVLFSNNLIKNFPKILEYGTL